MAKFIDNNTREMAMQQGWLALLLSGLWLFAASAQAASPEEAQKVFDEARQAATEGPNPVPLSSQAVLKLPATPPAA